MIEQIIYINLDRRTDRKEWFVRRLEESNVPMDIVTRYPGHDWRDYPSCRHLLDAIQSDGYARFVKAKYAEPRFRGLWACNWSYCNVLKEIIESGKVTMVLQDDVHLNVAWTELLDKVNQITSHLWSIQLRYGSWLRRSYQLPQYNDNWRYGVCASEDRAIVFTPFGADRLLSNMAYCRYGFFEVESVLYYLFNNEYTFHPTDGDALIKIGNLTKPSDINTVEDPMNFKMLEESE